VHVDHAAIVGPGWRDPVARLHCPTSEKTPLCQAYAEPETPQSVSLHPGFTLDSNLADLLTCPACMGEFLPGDGAVCSRCGSACTVADGIVSLIAEGAHTALDEIDYDAVYRVDAPASLAFAKSYLDILGDRLPSRIDTFLEIGAGTGLFTLGFLMQVPTRKALITDISVAMLQNCRRRLLDNGVCNRTELQFAAWDGVDCLRPGAFDLIAGFSVLHHVLDYQSMLCSVRRALRDDGIALFLEPNYRFHAVLVDVVCEIFTAVAEGHALWTQEDRNALGSWLWENNTNLRFRGDDRVLAGREDKHMFDGTQLGAAARAAGFDRFELVPLGERSECYTALKVYSEQIGLQDVARNDLLTRFARLLPGQFAHLADEDRAPSALIVLGVGNGERTSRRPESPAAPMQVEIAPEFRYDLKIEVAQQGEGWTMAVHGWLLGDTDVNYVCVDMDFRVYSFPLQSLREDVNRAFNSASVYPIRRALFSGVADKPQVIERITTSRPARLMVSAADGREFVIAEFVLAPGLSTQTLTRVDGG
jgi:ubiquinone/menaquinone biosynthesis C-methylase UbiE